MENPVMGFRTAYLRAIADCWAEERKGEKGLYNELVNSEKGILPTLEKRYSFESPWKDIKVYLIDEKDNSTEWIPMETAGWIGSNDFFVINLPNRPDPEEQGQALAAYYCIFPTLFGRKSDSKSRESALPTDLGVAPEKFLEFGGVTLRAIALAWKDDKFLVELTNPNLEDATPILSRYLGYNNPWNFSIQFKQDANFRWDGSVWLNIPKNSIKLHYPRKPDNNYTAVALTSYNNTGPEYPFTCS